MPEFQEYDEKGHLTSDGMKLHLGQNRVVLHRGRVIEHKDQIPTDAELAGDDSRRQEAARAQIMAQMEALQAQLALIGSNQRAADATVPEPSANGEPARVPTGVNPDGTLAQGPGPEGEPTPKSDEETTTSKSRKSGGTP